MKKSNKYRKVRWSDSEFELVVDLVNEKMPYRAIRFALRNKHYIDRAEKSICQKLLDMQKKGIISKSFPIYFK